ncbi:MAG: sugar phosphate isomerase/epimerase, partial [Propioniciclava sp.]
MTYRLSLNTATTKHWTLEQAVTGARDAGLENAARIVRDAGLRVSSLCRGGFLSAADPEGIAAALEDNRSAIREAQA